MIKIIKTTIANIASIKIVFYLIALFFCLPLTGLMYWFFDSHYLGAFGVGPELFSRPLFSSRLINLWLTSILMKPGIQIWAALCAILFLALLVNFYSIRKKGAPPKEPVDKTPSNWLLKFIFVLEKAYTPSAALLITGLTLLLALTAALQYISNKAKELANTQIESFVKDGECKDTFNKDHSGCYSISNELGDENLLILNNADTVIFITKKPVMQTNASDTNRAEPLFNIVIKNKLTQEKIVREFKYAKLSTRNSDNM